MTEDRLPLISSSLVEDHIQMVKTQVAIDYEKVVEFCRHWKITELALFGSVLRDDFRPDDSDIDVLEAVCK